MIPGTVFPKHFYLNEHYHFHPLMSYFAFPWAFHPQYQVLAHTSVTHTYIHIYLIFIYHCQIHLVPGFPPAAVDLDLYNTGHSKTCTYRHSCHGPINTLTAHPVVFLFLWFCTPCPHLFHLAENFQCHSKQRSPVKRPQAHNSFHLQISISLPQTVLHTQ